MAFQKEGDCIFDIIIKVLALIMGFISIFRIFGIGNVLASLLFALAFLLLSRSQIINFFDQCREQHKLVIKGQVTRDFFLTILAGVLLMITFSK